MVYHAGEDGGRCCPRECTAVVFPWATTADFPYKFRLTDSYDAMINAFHRRSVPYLLPYVFMKKGSSEWLSQAAHFWVMERCFPHGALSFTKSFMRNPQHREYARGLSQSEFSQILRENFEPYSTQFRIHSYERVKGQFESVQHVRDLETIKYYVESRSYGVEELCAPFKKRFEDWVASWIDDWPVYEL